MSKFWKVPRSHPGATFVCIAGGPSLRDFDLSLVRDTPGVVSIAVNNAAVTNATWANYYFFGDGRWWRWHEKEIAPDCPARILTASCRVFKDGRVLRLNKEYDAPLSHDPTSVSGLDSGRMAINVAHHLGGPGSKIILLGYDMKFAEDGESHHHPDHEIPSLEDNYIRKFAPAYPEMVAELNRLGTRVLRCTPSLLTCVPEMTLAEALAC